MARRGAPGDGADGLIDVVVASIAILGIALLGLILWLNTEVFEDDSAEEQAAASASATDAADGEAADIDGGPDTAGDEVGPPGDTASEAAATQGRTGSPPAEAGPVPQGGTAGTGLFSADDPGRVPAISVASAARGVRTLRADLDGDGIDERIWAAIVRDRVVIRVESVVDGVWTPRTTHEGAPADRLLRLAREDLNDDGELEVYTVQWVATEGESVTLWSVPDGALMPMDVVGGCWGGGNTLGIVGTRVGTPGSAQPTIAAICPEEGQPRHRWPSALYRWDDGHWMYDGQRAR